MHIAPHDNRNRAIVDMDNALVPLVYFNIVNLTAGGHFDYRTPGYETCVVPATGTVTVEAAGETFAAIGHRGVDVWDGEPEGVYVPQDTGAGITALTDTEVYIAGARFAETLRPFAVRAADIDRAMRDFTTAHGAYDVIFDAVGKSSFGECRAALKPEGIYLTTVPGLGILWHMLTRRKPGKRGRLATTGLRPVANKLGDMQVLRELVMAGAIRPTIDRRYPLAQVAEAHRYVETERKAGDVVVEIQALLA